MVSGVLGATSEAVVLRSMRACLIVAIVVAAITGCSRAKLLPVTPNADPRDYFPEAVQQRLAIAVERGDAEGIAAAVKAGADVDKPGGEGIRPIMWALVKGNVEGFRHLLEHDADLLARFLNPTCVSHGFTVAEQAARNPNKAFLRVMLERGFDPDTVVQPKRGETLLFLMVTDRDHEGAAMLLEAGADANWRSRYDEVPLIQSVCRNDFKTANVLYERGADPELSTTSGLSVVAYLKGLGSRNVPPEQQSAFDTFVDAMVERGLLTRQDIIEADKPKPGPTTGVEIIEHPWNSPMGRAIREMDAKQRRANQRRATPE